MGFFFSHAEILCGLSWKIALQNGLTFAFTQHPGASLLWNQFYDNLLAWDKFPLGLRDVESGSGFVMSSSERPSP